MSPDGSRLAVIGEEELSLYAVAGNVLKAEPLWTVTVPGTSYQLHLRELAFAPDGHTLGVRIGESDFRTFDVATGKLLRSHGFETGYPDNGYVVLGPGGRSIVLTSRKQSLGTRLLAFDTGVTLPLEHPPHLYEISTSEGGQAFRWSKDGKMLVGTARLEKTYDAIICLWNAVTGQLVASWPFGPGHITAAMFTRDDKGVLAVSDEEVWQIDIASGNVTKHPRKVAYVQDVALSPDGRLLFTGDRLGAIRRWDFSLRADTTPSVQSYECAAVSTGGALALIRENNLVTIDATGEHTLSPPEAIGHVKLSPSGEFVATGRTGLQLWSTRSNRLVGALPETAFPQRFAVADGWLAYVSFSTWFLHRMKYTAAGITELPPLDLETPCVAGKFSDIALSQDQTRLAVTYGPGFDGNHCASAGPDDFPDNVRARPNPGETQPPYRLRVYDTTRWSVVASRGISADQAPSVAIEANGDVIALGTATGIELWSSAERRTIANLPVNAELAQLTFVPGRRWVAVGLSSGEVQIHDYEKASLVADLDAHPGSVVCLDAAGTRLVSTGFEGTTAVWTLGAPPPQKP